jgi:hypothetical protein
MHQSSRPNCDTTTEKLSVVNLVSEQDVSMNENVARHCHFGFGAFAPMK